MATRAAEGQARRRLPRRAAIPLVLAVVVLLVWLALTSSRPAVPEAPAPGIPEAAAARDFLDGLRAARRAEAGWAEVVVPAADVPRLAAIGGHAAGLPRIEAAAEEGILLVRASLPAGLGRWLDVRLATRGAEAGVPDVRAALGPLRLPPPVVRFGADVARHLLRPLGLRLPPFEAMIGGLRIDQQAVRARIRLPGGTGAVGTLASARTAPLSAGAVRAIYCRLASAQAARPAEALEVQVRRAFEGPVTQPVEANRAAFVALAMLAVSPRVGELAGLSPHAVADCAPPAAPLRLAGRADLAKHWALSAALAATLGEPLSLDLGQWKELADSDGGTGFSFVDIAANRSGLAWARRATEPATAAAARAELAAINRAQLFPIELLAEAEGLSAAEFDRRYGALGSAEYRAVVERVDRRLARARDR